MDKAAAPTSKLEKIMKNNVVIESMRPFAVTINVIGQLFYPFVLASNTCLAMITIQAPLSIHLDFED